VTASDPAAVGVIVTEHDADAPVPANVQLPLGVKVTVPVGVVGPTAVSVTVALQLVGWLTATVDGEHVTVVVVPWSAPNVTLVVPLLMACVASPPYDAVTVNVPATLLVYDTEHVPALSVQLVGVKVPPVAVKLTVPVGVVAPAPLVSATVAVHVVLWPIVTVDGEHDTVVVVVLNAPVTVAALEVLPA
jgi:hypothetical protein